MEYDALRVDADNRVGLSVRNLSVGVNKKTEGNDKLRIVDDVSFDLQPGEMLAIMGGSGSGKTSLLNSLSQRLNVNNKKLEFEGQITYTRSSGASKVRNAYLLQTDVFLPGLTVYETLKYQADLRLSRSVSEYEKTNLIKSLLELLEIKHLENTWVNSFTSGTTLSGGEQRRVSLAVQLLTSPSLLFLDEPTTGLDSTSSSKLINVLKKLASPKIGITIVLSIHQPREDITSLFDHICILSKGGRMLFYGPLANSISYFQQYGCIPQGDQFRDQNILESIMGNTVVDLSSPDAEKGSQERISHLAELWKENQSLTTLPGRVEDSSKHFKSNLKCFEADKRQKISFIGEVMVTSKRVFVLSYRDWTSLAMHYCLCVFMAIASGWMFYKPEHDLAGIRSITSTLYVMLEVIAFCPMLLEVERLWSFDGLAFFREYQENCVSVGGFIVSRRIGKFLIEDLPFPIIFSSITYFMWGLRMSTDGDETTSSYFFIYLAFGIVVYFIGISSSMLCCSISSDLVTSTLITNILYQLQNSACGYFINAATMPIYVRWLKYTAYFWYAFGGLCSNQYTNWMGDCPRGDMSACTEYSGNYQLEVLGYPQGWIGAPIGYLIAFALGFNVLAYLGYKFKNFEMIVAGTKRNTIGGDSNGFQEDLFWGKKIKQDGQGSKSTFKTKNEEDNQDLSVTASNITLTRAFSSFKGKTRELTLLNNISATFLASSINVIMGPSGGGKTTLLNFLSNRLAKFAKFKVQGEIMLNHVQQCNPSDLARIAAYVTQQDSALISNLTVRETLYYQAKLRLPLEKQKNIPQTIDSLIRQTGLVDCADTLIGSDYVKGVSGGEKRRVSIAIQLLSNPKVLFLDEPTSGLDSSTAIAILQLLKKVAKTNGSTVIMTIHQPSRDMFANFDSVLLLVRGGRVVFNGSRPRLFEYFNKIEHNVPYGINPADHLLDVVSRGADETEETFNARINYLVSTWASESNVAAILGSKNVVDIRRFEKSQLPFMNRLKCIIERSFLNSYRSFTNIIARSGQTIILAIIHALFFAPLHNGASGISNRLGLVQEVLNLYFVGFINNVGLFPPERDLFYQEYKDSTYGVVEFNLAYLSNELPTEILPSLFFAAMIVFVCGLPRTAGMFFTMFATSVVSINCGESLGIAVNAISNHLGVATNVLCQIVILAVFMGGTMSLHMPSFFKAFNYTSPLKYAVGVCAKLAFKNQVFDCGAEGCVLDTGDKVLRYYNMDINFAAFMAALFICMVVYRLIAVGALFIRVRHFI